MSGVEADPPPPPAPPPWRGCQLDRDTECLTLDQILQSFSAPISEEHAWAVIHQVGHETGLDSPVATELGMLCIIYFMLAVITCYQVLICKPGQKQ